MNTFPVESQQRLLVENGLSYGFAAQWVSIEDGNEVSRRLPGTTETLVACDFKTVMRSYSSAPERRIFWITELAPGWSHILILGDWMPSAETLSRGGHRVFEIVFLRELGEIEPPFHAHDGAGNTDFFSDDEYSVHWEDLESYSLMPPVEEFEQQLIIIGRIAGRFLDRDWFSSQGLLGQAPVTD